MTGKSTAMSHLILQSHSQFDLVIAFTGNRHCQPALCAMMEKHGKWDDRFFYDSWNCPLVETLLKQQTALLDEGVNRHVLIVMDDCVLDARAEQQIAHMAMRGRHFNISLLSASVSYTAINKRVRRSLDYLW